MLPTIFTEKACFVRGFLQISQKKLPKRAFRARLPSNFKEPCFQNERFARCFRQFCKKKLPKWSFRAKLPPNFTEQASKTSVSRDASDNFHEKFAFRYSFAQSTHRFLREGSSAKSKKCASHYNAVHSQISKCTFRYSGVHKNVWIYPPWTDPLRAHKNVRFYYSFGRSTPRFYREGWSAENEICVSLQFRAIDTTFFTERVHREQMKFAFRYSFGRSTPRFYREGSPRANEICVSLQFWAIDTTFVARGLTARKWNLRFATVLGDRRRVFSERVAFRLTLPIPPGGIE